MRAFRCAAIVLVLALGSAHSAVADTARPSPVPSCHSPTVEANVVKAFAPDYPDSARWDKLPSTIVIVEVAIDEHGNAVSFTVAESSGRADIDGAALRAAKVSTYSPKIENCAAVAGTYRFRAEFDPDPAQLLAAMHAPAFTPPVGWARNNNPSPPANAREFQEWTHGKDFIGLMGAITPRSLQVYIDIKTRALLDAKAVILSSDPIPLCNDSTKGWKLAYGQGDAKYVEVVQMDGMRVYESFYYSPDKVPDSAVLDSLASLCAAT